MATINSRLVMANKLIAKRISDDPIWLEAISTRKKQFKETNGYESVKFTILMVNNMPSSSSREGEQLSETTDICAMPNISHLVGSQIVPYQQSHFKTFVNTSIEKSTSNECMYVAN